MVPDPLQPASSQPRAVGGVQFSKRWRVLASIALAGCLFAATGCKGAYEDRLESTVNQLRGGGAPANPPPEG